jgi:diaminohydroxyphosphoribosylaminopyrimidine deaminase/5-amino-6-(5-phosphoribosylamino)uracil reductase
MATQQEIDAHWMRRAIEIALLGRGTVSPNPLVGCVIARGTELISEGYHEVYGGKHAEINALDACIGQDLTRATMYVTLEPCAHHGKQPPCSDAIAATAISRIVVGIIDPHPAVSGKGLATLQHAGKELVVGTEHERCNYLTRYFLHSVATGLPYIIAKVATSQDNKISSSSTDDRWITNEESRTTVHQLRSELDAVMVGIGTVVDDDPMLDVRLVDGRNPARVIIDPSCRLDPRSRIANTMNTHRTLIVVNSRTASPIAVQQMLELGAEIIALDAEGSHLPPAMIARELHQRGIQSILLEGGPVTLDNFMHAKLVQEVHIHRAGHVIGAGREWTFHLDSTEWQLHSTQSFDTDVHLVYRRSG